MYLQLLIGRVKYTSCGHIMNLEHVPIPCDSTTCVTSPNHSWVRRLGTRHSLGCNACTADLACLDHHTCQAVHQVAEMFEETIVGHCPSCSP